MLIQSHATDCLIATPALPLVGAMRTTEGVPRLLPALAEQARVLQALQRGRGIATPQDLLRGVLASVLGPLAPRRLEAGPS